MMVKVDIEVNEVTIESSRLHIFGGDKIFDHAAYFVSGITGKARKGSSKCQDSKGPHLKDPLAQRLSHLLPHRT